jgi:gas vesicle protein
MAEGTDPTILGNDVQVGGADRGEGTAKPAIIRAEIRETRERMGDTIEEIGERLNPERLKEQVKDGIRDATTGRVKTMAQNAADRVNEARQSITNTIRENPIPAAMVGVGLGWLIWGGRQQGASGSGSRYAARARRGLSDVSLGGSAEGTEFSGPYAEPSAAFAASERGGGIGESVKETAGELADRAQNVAGTVAEQTRTQSRRVQEQFFENPLAIGTATLALGLAAGLAVPATRKEAELVGDARDKLVDRVRNVARETSEKVQQVAERVVDEVQVTGRQAGQEQGLAR